MKISVCSPRLGGSTYSQISTGNDSVCELVSRRRIIRQITILTLVTFWASFLVQAQTYRITDVSTPGVNPSFATGVNASGQVSGYSTVGANGAQAWRFTLGTGTVNLGSFGGTDSRANGINDAGTVTGFSRDAAGLAHGFVFSTATGLLDIGGFGNGEGAFPQHINAAGQAAG